MTASALITGCSGLVLTSEEISFFREIDPWGLILFQRNCEGPEQIKALVASYRELVGREDAPVLIDQEGGRVQRLKPPMWRQYPTAQQLGNLYVKDKEQGLEATYLMARLIAEDLHALGISVDCLPVLDVPQSDADGVIGDRAYGNEPELISILAAEATRGLMDGGVLPVVKHIPGHGRAMADSHFELPCVDTDAELLCQTDFAPFKRFADAPMAMTAHVVYEAYDSAHPATLSSTVIQKVIREFIGFDGVLMTDDLSMKALSGSFQERTQRAFAAGCDVVLHCNGEMTEMVLIAEETPLLAGKAQVRAEKALSGANYPQDFDRERAVHLHSSLAENGV